MKEVGEGKEKLETTRKDGEVEITSNPENYKPKDWLPGEDREWQTPNMGAYSLCEIEE